MKYNADQFISEFYCLDENNKRNLTELQKRELSARDRNQLYHYTSLDSLKKIFSNKSLRFNRIDRVNDRMEHNLFGEDELSHLVFVSCFSTEETESIPMWHLYGKNNNSLRLMIELETPDFIKNFLDDQGKTITKPRYPLYREGEKNATCEDWLYTISMKDIVYDIDAIKCNPIRRECKDTNIEMFDLTAMAAIKRKEWNYEHECRLIATLRTTRNEVEAPNINEIFVPIKFNNIKKLEITFNPWMNKDIKLSIKRFMNSIDEIDTSCIFYRDSILDEELEEPKYGTPNIRQIQNLASRMRSPLPAAKTKRRRTKPHLH